MTVTADHDGDAVDEEQATLTHTASSLEDDYDGLKAADVTVTITDDDEPGVSISKTSLDIEEGGSDTYEVELDTEPAGDVTVTIRGNHRYGPEPGPGHPDLHRTELGPAAEGDRHGGPRRRRGRTKSRPP